MLAHDVAAPVLALVLAFSAFTPALAWADDPLPPPLPPPELAAPSIAAPPAGWLAAPSTAAPPVPSAAPADPSPSPPPPPGPPRAVEPWSDADPGEPKRYALGDFGIRPGAEYRANFITVDPISLNSETNRNISWIEHRMRLDATVDYLDKVRVTSSVDLLDGTLWGDNGDYGGNPSSNAGLNTGAKNPNNTRPCIGLTGPNALQADSYGYILCNGNAITVRKLYGDVVTPIGLLRVGRQSVNVGTGIQSADGDGRPNRFGFSRTGNVVDRILFATKPLEAFKPKGERDTSPNRGLILAFAYDRWVTDSPQVLTQAVNQWDTALRYSLPRYSFGSDLLLAVYHAYRWDGQYGAKINSFGGRALSRFGAFQAGAEVAFNVGSTREVSTAYKVITNDPVVDQAVQQLGARAVVRYDQPLYTLYLEGDYASGDDDPSSRSALTQFTFAEDTNIGLLMFKQVLAFQTARSSAAAVETLRRLGATTFPAEAINSRGAFTDAAAIFPQFDVHPHPSVLLRGGVLVAWAPAGVIDPVASLQRRNNLTGQTDLVNYAGGRPGHFYGTELDARVQWRFVDHFALDLEGAILFPGDAFQNADGYAVRSSMFQARTTFFF